jgi:hypothetical protein
LFRTNGAKEAHSLFNRANPSFIRHFGSPGRTTEMPSKRERSSSICVA